MAWTTPRTWIPGETPDATMMNQHVRDNLLAILPVGTLIHRVAMATSVETVVENRFLECNGVAVSRATYPALVAYLFTMTPPLPFGVGDNVTTFNLPDLRGRSPWSHSPAGGHADVTTIGSTDGEAIAKRTPKHWHELLIRDGVGGGAPLRQGNNVPTNTGTTLSGTTPLDAPAYQVTGVWYIKYTA